MPTYGLVFFSDRMPRPQRRQRVLFLTVYFAALLSLIWPVYPLFSGIYPLLLGLPLSLWWVTLWLIILFAALLWLFLTGDNGHSGDRSRQRSEKQRATV